MKTLNVHSAADLSGRIGKSTKRRSAISVLYAFFSLLWTSMRNYAGCVLAILCLMIVASENPYFPWPNMAGLAVLTAIVVLFGKRHPH